MKELLPIGSVVSSDIVKTELKGYNKYVIIGRSVKCDYKDFDYLCVKYPFGFIDEMRFFYINESDITSLIFLGDINY